MRTIRNENTSTEFTIRIEKKLCFFCFVSYISIVINPRRHVFCLYFFRISFNMMKSFSAIPSQLSFSKCMPEEYQSVKVKYWVLRITHLDFHSLQILDDFLLVFTVSFFFVLLLYLFFPTTIVECSGFVDDES